MKHYKQLDRAIRETDSAVLGAVPAMVPYIFDDGGRATAGYKGRAGDCVCRAFAIATGLPYREVYDSINSLAQAERLSKRRLRYSSARHGVHKDTTRKYAASLGWRWVPKMQIGQGCMVHLRSAELPAGRIIVKVSRHLVAVVNGVIHDTHDSSRRGTRCVYGYFVEGPSVTAGSRSDDSID